MNDLSALPEHLRDITGFVLREWDRDPSRRLSDLLKVEDVPDGDIALILDSVEPGAGAVFLR